MLIKFKEGDPRAGMVARMDDSYRGQALIDAGAAVRVNEDGTEVQVDSATAGAPAGGQKTQKPEGKPSDGLKVEELRAALEAKGIAIPEGAKKGDLQKLLDEAQ